MDMPDLRLLAYSATRPMLRVMRLPARTHEPAPMSLDTGYALDGCIRREGWVAFNPAPGMYGLPLPFGERPFRISREEHSVLATGTDSRTVWLGSLGERRIEEYDGVARETRRELELPGPARELVAATANAFVLHRADGLLLWAPPGEPAAARRGSGRLRADGQRARSDRGCVLPQ